MLSLECGFLLDKLRVCSWTVVWKYIIEPLCFWFFAIIWSENGRADGSISGIPTSSRVDKIWLVAQALGDIAFSYPFSVILIEIQVCISKIIRKCNFITSFWESFKNYKVNITWYNCWRILWSRLHQNT